MTSENQSIIIIILSSLRQSHNLSRLGESALHKKLSLCVAVEVSSKHLYNLGSGRWGLADGQSSREDTP